MMLPDSPRFYGDGESGTGLWYVTFLSARVANSEISKHLGDNFLRIIVHYTKLKYSHISHISYLGSQLQ